MQFLAVGLLVVVAILVGTNQLSSRAATEEAITDARATTRVLARSVAEPAIPRGLVAGRAGAVDRFDREVLDRLMVGDVQRIKIWAADGTIVYSDRTELIGSRYALGRDERDVLRDGGSDAEVSDLAKPENRFERASGGLVEVYTRIASPEGQPLLFEAYYARADVEQRKQQVFAPFQRITVGALLVLLAVATPMLWILTRRLTRAAAERERLLRTAMTASEAERRRIARDLHDGVVQDLAGTAFTVSALARDEAPRPGPARRTRPGGGLPARQPAVAPLAARRDPPTGPGRGAPAGRPRGPHRTGGVRRRGHHGRGRGHRPHPGRHGRPGLAGRPGGRAQRPAARPAPRRSACGSDTEGDRVVLVVTDDGVGFDPATARRPDSFGLRGLESLVADAGGTLDVRSRPGAGTTVRLEVARR